MPTKKNKKNKNNKERDKEKGTTAASYTGVLLYNCNLSNLSSTEPSLNLPQGMGG